MRSKVMNYSKATLVCEIEKAIFGLQWQRKKTHRGKVKMEFLMFY